MLRLMMMTEIVLNETVDFDRVQRRKRLGMNALEGVHGGQFYFRVAAIGTRQRWLY